MSHKFVSGAGTNMRINTKEDLRAQNVAQIIKEINADIVGIVECMPQGKL